MTLRWPWLTWSGSFANKGDEIVLDLLERFEVIHNEHMPFTGLAGNIGEFIVVHISHTNNEHTESCKVPWTRESHILFPSFIVWAIKTESIRDHAVSAWTASTFQAQTQPTRRVCTLKQRYTSSLPPYFWHIKLNSNDTLTTKMWTFQ